MQSSRAMRRSDLRRSASARHNGQGQRVDLFHEVVVDDVIEQCEIAEKMLSKLGYQVISVTSGQSAISYIETHNVDLLVLDMVMPDGMDGLATGPSFMSFLGLAIFGLLGIENFGDRLAARVGR